MEGIFRNFSLFPLFFLLSIFSIGFSRILTQRNGRNGEKCVISLYYESMCGGCMEFDREQLYPLYAKIPEYIDIDLIPYGNSMRTQNPDGSWNISCQHGQEECYGNKLHACALSELPHQLGLHFVGCTMGTNRPPKAGPKCAKTVNLTQSEWAGVKSCAEGEKGDALILKNAERTESLDPPHQWVPWVLFNGQYSDADMKESETDLLGVVCRHLEPSNIPPECNQVN